VNISYSEPLTRAWNRTKRMLFSPFHAETWFVVGFSAFLARLFSSSGMGSNWNMGSRHGTPGAQVEQATARVRDTFATVMEHPAILMAIAAGLCALLVLGVVLAWVSARAEFVFLDNVATGRSGFTERWRRFGSEGQSLFLWRAVFSFAYLPSLVLILAPFAQMFVRLLGGGGMEWPGIGGLFLPIGIGVLLLFVLCWISMLMDNFVVPLMYRHHENATQAWARFWPLLTGHLGAFIAWTVFLVVLTIVVGIGLAIVGFGTCCIGIVLMALPYIGSVVLLPVHITGRALGPEFLAQFGPEWNAFPAAPEAEESAEAPRPVV
jgi:hypothetical protein